MSDLHAHVDTLLAEKAKLTKNARRSKRKGANGERAVAELAKQAGFEACRRNFGSGASGGNDLVNIGELAVEVKCVERLNVQAAYDQCCAAARPTETPVVAHKRSRKDWLVTLDLETFLALYAQALKTGEASMPP